MRRPALYPIALALGATTLVPGPAAHGATAIAACQTISAPGSYVLANNLSAGDCLVITGGTDFVTIDLAGFSISGNGTGTGIITAVSGANPHRGIAVRNGSISNFRNGVDLDFAQGSIVEGLRVFGSTLDGIHAFGIARGNTVADNHSFGLLVFGTVTGNYAAGNDIGIAGGWTVTGNTAVRNRLGTSLSAGSTVIGNAAFNNTQIGFSVDCPSNLTDNTAIDNPTNLTLNGTTCHNEDNVAP
jgi:hypothetical protein